MSVVKGKQVSFQVVSKDVKCLRSCTLDISTSLIETTTAGSGLGATYAPQKNNTTGSAEGIEYLNEGGSLTIAELRQFQLAHTLLSGFMVATDESSSTASYTFDFYIVRTTTTGAVGDFSTFQFDFQVQGDPVITL